MSGSSRLGPSGPTVPRWVRRARWANWVLLLTMLAVTALCAVRYFSGPGASAGHTVRQGWPPLLLSTVLLLVLAVLAALRPLTGSVLRAALASALAALVFAAGTVATWQLIDHDNDAGTIVGTPLVNSRQATRYIAKAVPGMDLKQIPTGVSVQSVKFTSPEEAEVSGYVWQRLSKDVAPADRGVVFPEAADGYDEGGMEKVYETPADHGRTTIGWRFNMTLRQNFGYAHYPIDKQNISLRMWSASAFAPQVLSPDFGSYPPWRYDRLGLDEDLVTNEWEPYYTGFSYDTHHYTTTQGLADYQAGGFAAAPELHFNVGIKRQYVAPLLGKLLQSLFIAAVMFLALFIYTKDERKKARHGYDTWTAVGFAASMLLVIVVDQTQLREVSGGTSLTYLEFFAVAQYIVIMGIFANAILVGSDRKVAALSWHDNLLPVLLYWPVLFGAFFVFGVLVFWN